jgi:hypothetical protein
MKGLFVLITALSMLIVVAALPAASQAAFTAPINLSVSGPAVFDPDVGIDGDGDAVAVWLQQDGTTQCSGGPCWRVKARARSAAGGLSSVQTLSGPGQNAQEPEVAVDPSGDAVAVWRRSDGVNLRIQARARSAAGTLSPTQNLSAAGNDAFDFQVGVDADGDAVAVWQLFEGTVDRIQARRRSASGVLGPVQYVSAVGEEAVRPRLAVAPTGIAVALWGAYVGGKQVIKARSRSATGTLSSIQTLSPPGQNADYPEVAVDANGDAVAVWHQYDGTTNCGGLPGCRRAQARARSAGGTLGPVQTLSAAGRHALIPQVAIDADGDGLIVWTRRDGTTDCSLSGAPCYIQARARSAAGALGPSQTLSSAGRSAFGGQVGIDADGDAVVVWQRFDGTTDCFGGDACLRVQARTRSGAGVLGPVQTLSASGGYASSARVAVDPLGDALGVWQLFDGTVDRIQAAAGP